ncbi:hypothetical protein NUW54_g4369 [Trametes sanguinea]|uniref:Uncharacterized protein n=1 Tax=Trametes sanguinea TaxID=158606 RepID=A0ACC1PY54_9APHY|nr:hypothetical protein NUW54_g4369 [Trametes sanguinea]
MASSQPTTTSHDSPRRPHAPRQPLLDSEPVQVAPYLTHVVAHHGQLTLIPPQNAGRIRKSKSSKKKRIPTARDDEPRFTTAVPPSSSRKLHPASAQIRTRKHAISAPSPTTPTTPTAPRFDPIPDDQSIPDYPPPSFEDAIASPHIPPHLVSIPSVQPSVQHSASIDTLGQHPYTSDVASQSSATILSSAALSNSAPAMSMTSLNTPLAQNQPLHEPQRPGAANYSQQHPYTSPAASQSSAVAFYSNVSPAISQASLSRPTEHTPSMSTTTLLSPAVTESTALSDIRSIDQSPPVRCD